jgi:hypothetical protein
MSNRNRDYTVVKKWWEAQKDDQWITLTDSFSKDSEVHRRFDSLIKTFYWRFREQKGLPKGTREPEIDFQGFEEFSIDLEGEMGHCKWVAKLIEEETFQERNGKEIPGTRAKTGKFHYEGVMSIVINRLYLLSKLGMDEFITGKPALSGNYQCRNVSFSQLIGTVAHELAHAYQNTINIEKKDQKEHSQCRSSGDKDANGNPLFPKLVAEHDQLTSEIEQMITSSSEYQEFQTWWNSTRSKEWEDTTIGKRPNAPQSPKKKNKNDTPQPDNSSSIPNSVQEYFKNHNVESIELVGDQWKIKYKGDSTTTTTTRNVSEIQELQGAKDYLKITGENILTAEQITGNEENNDPNSPTQPEKGTSLTPLILGGSIIILVFSVIIIYSKSTKKSAKRPRIKY